MTSSKERRFYVASAAEADGDGGVVWAEVRDVVFTIRGPGEAAGAEALGL